MRDAATLSLLFPGLMIAAVVACSDDAEPTAHPTPDIDATVYAAVQATVAAATVAPPEPTATPDRNDLLAFTEEVFGIESERDGLVALYSGLSPLLYASAGVGTGLIAPRDGRPGLPELRTRLRLTEAPQEASTIRELLLEAYALEISEARREPSGRYASAGWDAGINWRNVGEQASQYYEGSAWVEAQRLRASAYTQWRGVLADAGVDLALYPALVP